MSEAVYPKMLYAGGIARDQRGRPVAHSDTRTVHSAAEEAEARAEGYADADAAPENSEGARADEVAPIEAAAPEKAPSKKRVRPKRPARTTPGDGATKPGGAPKARKKKTVG